MVGNVANLVANIARGGREHSQDLFLGNTAKTVRKTAKTVRKTVKTVRKTAKTVRKTARCSRECSQWS